MERFTCKECGNLFDVEHADNAAAICGECADLPCHSPGKFEGERKAAEYAYEASMDGWADGFGDVNEWNGYYSAVDLGEPIGTVYIVEDSNGFVSEISKADYEAAESEYESMGDQGGED